MVTLARRAQRIPFAPVVALLFGIAAAVLVAAVPQWMFEAGVVASGLPTLLSAAAPPLGLVARILAIALAFGAVAFVIWAIVAPLTQYFEARARARTPWRDAGYDAGGAAMDADFAPPRRPIFAPDELGAPLMSDEAMALASKTAAVPAQSELEPSLAPIAFDDLRGVATPGGVDDNSITGLIERLEQGLARRAANDTDPDGSGAGKPPFSRDELVLESIDTAPLADDDTDNSPQAFGTFHTAARR